MILHMLTTSTIALALLPVYAGDITPLKIVRVSLAVDVQAHSRKAIFTVVNSGTVDVTFAPRADFLVAYVIRNGKRIAITWDGANADMKPLGLFDIVTLVPGSTYRKQTTLDLRRSGQIRLGEVAKAVLQPLSYYDFEPGLRAYARNRKAQLLPSATASPQVGIR